MSNLQNKFEGEKLIYNGSDTMWKLNLVIEQFSHNNYQLYMQNHSQKRLNMELNTKLY